MLRTPKSQKIENLSEWKEKLVYNSFYALEGLSLEEQHFIHLIRNQIEIQPSRAGIKVKTKNWVGVVILNNVRLNIYPKFDPNFHYLPQILEYSKYTNFHNLDQLTQMYIGERQNLIDILVRTFLFSLTNLLRQGLQKDYLEKEEQLQYWKGHLDSKKQIQQNFMLKIPLNVIYDDLQLATWENQIIYTTLIKISSWPINKDLRKKIRIFMELFNEFCSNDIKSSEFWRNFRFTYNRKNEYYRNAHQWCKYLLFGYGVEDIFICQENDLFCFLVDMNKVFERFVTQLLKDHLEPKKQILSQNKYWQAIRYKKKKYSSVKPDVVILDKNQEISEIIDIKYKIYNEKKKIPTNDIYQLYFYINALQTNCSTNYPQGKIIFCQMDDLPKNTTLDLNEDGLSYCILKTYGINIINILELLRNGRKQELKEIIFSIVSS